MTHLDDNLDDIFPASDDLSASTPALPRGAMKQRVLNGAHDQWQAEGPAIHKDKCESCRGTGQFTSWSGRTIGQCFKCKGRGFRMFKTSAESRRIGREKATERKATKQRETIEAFAEAHPTVFTWIEAKQDSFDFALKMKEAIVKWGALTPGQLAAVERCIAKDAERDAQRAADKAAAPAIDMSKVVAAIDKVRGEARKDGEGVRWPRVTIGEFRFTEMPANGQWEACIFVKRGADKLGRVIGGKFHRFRACDDATEAAVIAAVLDPAGTAKAFGQRTGVCCCCGRELTNKDSRKEGIGPICASKHGW